MKKIMLLVLMLACLCQALLPGEVRAACAKVSMEILQEVTIERVAFDAKLAITNGIPDYPIDHIRVDVTIRDFKGNLKNDLFFIRPPSLTGMSGTLDGSGSVSPSGRGESHWLIIPSPGAGYIESNGSLQQVGVDYWVGATLTYSINGTQEVVSINPAKITVKPMPQLVLDYFMPYQVIGDNPFTPQAEPPVPYPLGVRVMNDGYGVANKLRIDSAQPKIVDNQRGLLVSFNIRGASVNDSPVIPSLTVDFGDLPSKRGATAAWQMISTLSGHFTEFTTSFTHASELGGDLTSLIKATYPHYLTHMVKVNLPGRDTRLDFLADVDGATGFIYESEIPDNGTDMTASRSLVTVVPATPPAHPTPAAPNVALTLQTDAIGWVYTRIADPSLGMLKLEKVVRADGVHLDPNNFWVDQGLDENYKKTFTLQFVDYRTDVTTPATYTLKFSPPNEDTTTPTTTVSFSGPVVGTNPAFITPRTTVILTAVDNEGGSGVDGMYRQVVGRDNGFVDATPLKNLPAGTYTLQYYSVDLAGNDEEAKSTTIVVVDAAPTVASFTVAPASFSPQAPRGVKADRSTRFTLAATSNVPSLPAEVAISSGNSFQSGQVVRILKGTATSGSPLELSWDGKDANGKLLPVGTYTARLKVGDGLDNPADPQAAVHTSTFGTDVTVTIDDWFKSVPVDPSSNADQLHAKISGTRAVWQDNRNSGRWDIYLKDLSGTDSSVPIPRGEGDIADRQYPAIDGNIVVWQELGSNGWDIYGFDLSAMTGSKFPISAETGDQTLPAISGTWVVWQDNHVNNNWDIYARNLANQQTVRLTDHERDQMHPAISGTTVSWEDYRYGPASIFQHDLLTGTETRIAFGETDETSPVVSGATVVCNERRNGQNDIYQLVPNRGALRVTYGTGDHGQAALRGDLLVYTDYETGPDDPNLSFRILSSSSGGRLTADPSRQEEPAIGTGHLLWQDNRSSDTNTAGHFQLYAASFETVPIDVEATIRPGFNLVAVGSALTSPSALIAAKGEELGIERILVHDQLHNTYSEVNSGEDITFVKGAGLVIYTRKTGTLKLADNGETASYTLAAGTNLVGMLTVPAGYSAYDLMKSVGLDNIQSVRRFDSLTGAWQTVAVRTGTTKTELLGQNFSVNPGDGLVLSMKNRVDQWLP